MCLKMNNKQQIRGLLKSFKFAFRGIIFCLKNERNMRIHCFTAVLISVFSVIYGLSCAEYAILFAAIASVIICEMFNTSVEALVDLQTSAYADLARIAKDVAAGAVSVSAVSAVVCGIMLFFHFPKLLNTFFLIITTPYYILPLAAYVIFGISFIFKGFEIFKIKKR